MQFCFSTMDEKEKRIKNCGQKICSQALTNKTLIWIRDLVDGKYKKKKKRKKAHLFRKSINASNSRLNPRTIPYNFSCGAPQKRNNSFFRLDLFYKNISCEKHIRCRFGEKNGYRDDEGKILQKRIEYKKNAVSTTISEKGKVCDCVCFYMCFDSQKSIGELKQLENQDC